MTIWPGLMPGFGVVEDQRHVAGDEADDVERRRFGASPDGDPDRADIVFGAEFGEAFARDVS